MKPWEKSIPCTRRQDGSAKGSGHIIMYRMTRGIVLKEDAPYVLVVLSDAYGRLDLLDNLVSVLDLAHTALMDNYQTDN